MYISFSFSLFQCSPPGQPDGERIQLTFIILFFYLHPLTSSPTFPHTGRHENSARKHQKWCVSGAVYIAVICGSDGDGTAAPKGVVVPETSSICCRRPGRCEAAPGKHQKSTLPKPNNLRTVVGEGRALLSGPAVWCVFETWQNNLRMVVSLVLDAAFPMGCRLMIGTTDHFDLCRLACIPSLHQRACTWCRTGACFRCL